MRIFVDENIPGMTVETLRKKGHDVADIRGTADEGMSDDSLWDKAQKGRRLLITTDKGFLQYREQPHCGILIIRLHQPTCSRIHQRIISAISQFGMEEWHGLSVVMGDTTQSMWRAKK